MDTRFMPQEWVICKIGTGHHMGQIVGASESGTSMGWYYSVTNVRGDTPYSVAEADIVKVLMSGSWEDASVR
jgi:hypothetical protein